MGNGEPLTIQKVISKGKIKIGNFEVCSKDHIPKWVAKDISKEHLLKQQEIPLIILSMKIRTLNLRTRKAIAIILDDRLIFWSNTHPDMKRILMIEDITKIEVVKGEYQQKELIIHTQRGEEILWLRAVAYIAGFNISKIAPFLDTEKDNLQIKLKETQLKVMREGESQNLEVLMQELPKILPEKEVSLSVIQERILSDKADLSETERLLLLLQEDKSLPGQYDPITQAFRRAEDQKIPQTFPSAEIDFVKDFICLYCGQILHESTEQCPDCGEKIVNCIICRQPIIFGEKVKICPQCSTKYHSSHIFESLKVQGKCPVCQVQISDIELIDWDYGKGKQKNKP